VLAGEAGWFGGGGHDHATPRRQCWKSVTGWSARWGCSI
jgi:hypothetical protein